MRGYHRGEKRGEITLWTKQQNRCTCLSAMQYHTEGEGWEGEGLAQDLIVL